MMIRGVIDSQDQREAIDSAAADWIARLGGGPLDEAEQRQFDHWLAADPAHGAAFDEARAAWNKMGQLAFTPELLAEDEAIAAAPVAAITASARPRLWPRLVAMAACLLITLGAATFWYGNPYTRLTADHQTAPGVWQQVTLADQSQVELGPDSAITVRYTEQERRIELISGRAFFTAAPMDDGERRPFVVAADRGTARALGTRFMVARSSEAVEVAVIEHEVRVSLADAEQKQSDVVLSPGHVVRYAGVRLGKVRAVKLDHLTAWRQGRLVFDRVPLGEVVVELNRYRRGRIVIVDPGLAMRQVSGVFNMKDPDSALLTITENLRINATSLPPLVTVLH